MRNEPTTRPPGGDSTGTPTVPLIFGEVLFDRFEDGREVLGGAPFNVAWHLRGFGLEPCFVSRVGRDERGDRIRSAMEAWGLSTRGLQVDGSRPTGVVRATVRDGQPEFHIEADQAYDHVDFEEAAAAAPVSPALLYHGSLALRTRHSRRGFEAFRAVVGAPAFLDVNLRAPWWELSPVLDLVRAAAWTKLSDGELRDLDTGDAGRPLEEAAAAFRERWGGRLLVVTRGDKGALGASGDGVEAIPAHPVRSMQDTVGAGDAFAAVCVVGLLEGWTVSRMLRRAARFAAAVVGIQGAIPEGNGLYVEAREAWERDEQ